MGLFDTIHCEYPLPDARHQDLEFQTKDLECLLSNYTITRDGRLVLHARKGGTEVTRPILEAFFHARFFLEMAVRYADLQAPPQPLPSGYAALLYLFGLR